MNEPKPVAKAILTEARQRETMPAAGRQPPRLPDLPTVTATEIGQNWCEIFQRARETGGVAVHKDKTPEVVILDARLYGEIVAYFSAQSTGGESLASLSALFDRQLAALQKPDARTKLNKILAKRGKARQPSKAGNSF